MRVEPVDPSRTHALRRAVLRPDADPDAPMPGDALKDALHLAALDGDTVIATCLVAPVPYPGRPETAATWQLRAMATDPAWRGRGAGRALLAAVDEQLRTRGAALVWCNARATAVGFYERHGFVAEGPPFVPDEPPIEHRRMWRAVEPATATTSSGRVERSDDRSRGA